MLKKSIGTHLLKSILLAVAAVVVLVVFASSTWFDLAYYKVVDNTADRGQAILSQDLFGDQFTKAAYLDQN